MSEELLTRYARAAADPQAPRLSTGELLALTHEYPWWPAPAIELLRRTDSGLDTETREHLRNIIALNCTDRAARPALTSDRGDLLAQFYPPERSSAAATTDDAISTFLETYGHSSPEEDRLLEQMIFNPVPDYGAVLAVDDEEDSASPFDAFVKAFSDESGEGRVESGESSEREERRVESGEIIEVAESADSTESHRKAAPAPASSLSESLAKIYIKQGRYNKAYEIILHLYLNNPKKSIYFADQLRFLRKLMLNSDYSNQATN